MSFSRRLSAGRPDPLGATLEGDGVNFAVFSAHATRITLCLFSDDGKKEVERIPLPECDAGIWYGHVAGITAGQAYGFRADGPYDPSAGHRFNPHKLLVDPYARQISRQPIWHHALFGWDRRRDDLVLDTRDSAPFAPRSIVVEPPDFANAAPRPRIPLDETIIYEAHVKGLTALHPVAEPQGKFLGLASDPILKHLTDLGVTAIELLPAQMFVNDEFLIDKDLTNYWGYQTLGFFAPDPRYLVNGDIYEFRRMVDRFHSAGIEVLMDVVYNHTCEGTELGPTLSFRGLDNLSYYRLPDDKRYYINDTGTGNTLNVEHPMVLRLIMDSLRYWVETMGIDGFRFDLAAVLGRTPDGFDQGATFFDAIRQDPVLRGVKLIAEPWDIGPGGYQLGAFPPPFQEWNDQFRDTVRRFWRGDDDQARKLAGHIVGSALQFDHSGRAATSSVNLVTAHDGFTLTDLVSYAERHNKANGEDNRDGHHANFSDNFRVEGATDDPEVLAARARRKRNLLATLLLSQGTPMLLAGDELGNSQKGNNNAYAQDNEISWIDWAGADEDLLAFTKALIAFRKAHPILRQKHFLHARERLLDGIEDLFWWRAEGTAMIEADWTDPNRQLICAELRMASGTAHYAPQETALFCVFNAGEEAYVVSPRVPTGKRWVCRIDTSTVDGAVEEPVAEAFMCPAAAVMVLVLEIEP